MLRPLLGCRRGLLAAAVAEAALRALTDPTNHDLAVPRNRLRHGLLAARPELVAGAGGLAAAAAGARARVESTVARLAPAVAGPAGAHLEVAALLSLPAELRPWALAGLARAAGLPYPPRRAAVAELLGQLARGSAAGCDAAAGWRWERRGERLELAPTGAAPAPAGPPGEDRGTPVRAGAEPGVARGRSAGPAPAPRRAVATPAFAYTLAVPGGVEIREAATIFRLTRQPVAPWMRRGSATRAALDLPLAAGDLVTVRSRRPGDRLRPLGGPGERRVKDVLIDRKVPRQQRDGLPLLCVGGRVAWVPGVTVDDAFRLAPDAREAWVAELLPADAGAEDAR